MGLLESPGTFPECQMLAKNNRRKIGTLQVRCIMQPAKSQYSHTIMPHMLLRGESMRGSLMLAIVEGYCDGDGRSFLGVVTMRENDHPTQRL